MSDTPSSPAAEPTKRVANGADAFFGYYPGAVAVVTSRHGERRNVMSAGWHTALSADPPLYAVAIAPERHSHGLIAASGWFGVNFLPFALAEAIAGAGLLSGAEVPDKLARLDLAWREDASGLPILDGAWASYACRVRDRVATGDHDLFVGDVARVHYDPDAFDGRVQDPSRVPGTVYYGRSTYEGLGAGPVKRVPPEAFRGPARTDGTTAADAPPGPRTDADPEGGDA